MDSQFVNPLKTGQPIFMARPLSLKKNYDQKRDVTMGFNEGYHWSLCAVKTYSKILKLLEKPCWLCCI